MDLTDLLAFTQRSPPVVAGLRALSSGFRLVTLAGRTQNDDTSLTTRSASGRFSTVALLGAVVGSGKWYLELTVRNSEMMQVAIASCAMCVLWAFVLIVGSRKRIVCDCGVIEMTVSAGV